mmetsp:Transcript_20753/g.42640  ORF Transcript_20753/g.42640 Transcript_20753/m.42640 type:complete len:106 (+) Transcript_20753:365-682(+)
MPMHNVDTAFLRWFCCTNHPDACNIESLETNLNWRLQAHYSTHQDKLLSFAQHYPDLHDWDGSAFPIVVVKIVSAQNGNRKEPSERNKPEKLLVTGHSRNEPSFY